MTGDLDYKSIIENVPACIILVDSKTKNIQLVNKSACRKLGFKDNELCNLKDIFSKGYKNIQAAIKKHKKDAIVRDLVMKKKHGTFPVSIHLRQVRRDLCMLVFRDISDEMQKEDEQKSSLMHLKKILDIAQFLIVVLDIDGTITMINKKACSVLGYEEKDLLGKKWFDTCIPSRIRKKVKSVARNIFAGEYDLAEYFDNPVMTKSGTERYIAWHNSYIIDDAGKISHTISSGEDITDKQKIETNLHESEADFEGIINSMKDIFYRVNMKGEITVISPAVTRVLGFNSDGLKGKRFSKLLHKDDQKMLQSLFKPIAGCLESEFRMIDHDGQVHHMRATSSRIVTSNFRGFAGFVADISENKKTEEAINNTARKWNLIFDSMLESVSLHSADGIILNANHSLCRLLGMKKEDIIGKKCYTLFHDKHNSPLFCPAQKSLISNKRETVEVFEPTLKAWLSITTSPIHDKNNNMTEIVHMVKDITARKRNAEELLKKNMELERFNRFAVGRELRMIELKKNIAELEKRLKKRD